MSEANTTEEALIAQPKDPCAAAVTAVRLAQESLTAAQAVLALCRATNPPKSSTPAGSNQAEA